EAGGNLADLSAGTMAALTALMPEGWSQGNPIDLGGEADGKRYAAALDTLFKDRNIDGVMVLNRPSALASSVEAARAVAEISVRAKPCVLTSWMGGATAYESRRLLAEKGLPTYDSPGHAARGFMHMVNYRRNQVLLTETVPSIPEHFSPDVETARGLLRDVLRERREWLTEFEAKAVLATYDIPVVPTEIAPTPEMAADIAARMGGTVALKILSPDILRKAAVGGVALDLASPAAVFEAASAMNRRVLQFAPRAVLQGFTVMPMIRRRNSTELILGVVNEPQFGPMILFGQGGTAVEALGDTALALPPLNMHLAHEVMSRTGIWRVLKGFPGRPPADLDAIAATLVKVSQLVTDLGEIVELDINPLMADENGVLALDARIRVAAFDGDPASRLAIRPYPRHLEQEIKLADGRHLLLRPVRPED
ncbi:MAG: acetate--CoA ligase family protein, partial [Rhodospirillales bacterium]|nr:acetate--CoA ligase family protein [Rhodospirillales bacterium]